MLFLTFHWSLRIFTIYNSSQQVTNYDIAKKQPNLESYDHNSSIGSASIGFIITCINCLSLNFNGIIIMKHLLGTDLLSVSSLPHRAPTNNN